MKKNEKHYVVRPLNLKINFCRPMHYEILVLMANPKYFLILHFVTVSATLISNVESRSLAHLLRTRSFFLGLGPFPGSGNWSSHRDKSRGTWSLCPCDKLTHMFITSTNKAEVM